MSPESEQSPYEAVKMETKAEIERLNNELDGLSEEDRSKRVQSIRDELTKRGLSTANKDQRYLVEEFVSKTAEELLGQN